MDNTLNAKTKKTEKETSHPTKKVADKSSVDHRFDYVCNFLGIKRDQAKDCTTLDLALDDICRMDFLQHFVNLKELVLIS